ncbi:MAG: antibiotic biosynthesis monooxygenase [SAR86 cluster bacterium]|uniref:Antibiotic biosynthesis monooxygenase n=1 Tax=SAR86 cluster bacterium TaxID=2030880 RepID=A0A2A4MSU6_9GAMM|nr:MAG: antibiotic biosynthesis monooxygenase [SAR86 cluster bacterium]
MDEIANTPQTPYYAVIFTSSASQDRQGYAQMAEKMLKLASQQTGFLGFESADDKLSISVSYWDSLDAIAQWKSHAEHLQAQQLGKSKWYKAFKTRVCRVERD